MTSGKSLTPSVTLISAMTDLLSLGSGKCDFPQHPGQQPQAEFSQADFNLGPVTTTVGASTDAMVDTTSPLSGQSPVNPWTPWWQVRRQQVFSGFQTLHMFMW